MPVNRDEKPLNSRRCDVRKIDAQDEKKGFLDRTRNLVIFFLSLCVIATFLTFLTVGIREEFGGVIDIGSLH